MSNGGVALEATRRRTEYARSLALVAVGALLMFLLSKWNPPLRVNSILIDYYGHGILRVERNGKTELSNDIVHHGLFDVDELFQQVLGALVNTWDEDTRVDQRLGTVRIFFNNRTSGTYFIYDREYLDELFAFARDNLVDNP